MAETPKTMRVDFSHFNSKDPFSKPPTTTAADHQTTSPTEVAVPRPRVQLSDLYPTREDLQAYKHALASANKRNVALSAALTEANKAREELQGAVARQAEKISSLRSPWLENEVFKLLKCLRGEKRFREAAHQAVKKLRGRVTERDAEIEGLNEKMASLVKENEMKEIRFRALRNLILEGRDVARCQHGLLLVQLATQKGLLPIIDEHLNYRPAYDATGNPIPWVRHVPKIPVPVPKKEPHERRDLGRLHYLSRIDFLETENTDLKNECNRLRNLTMSLHEQCKEESWERQRLEGSLTSRGYETPQPQYCPCGAIPTGSALIDPGRVQTWMYTSGHKACGFLRGPLIDPVDAFETKYFRAPCKEQVQDRSFLSRPAIFRMPSPPSSSMDQGASPQTAPLTQGKGTSEPKEKYVGDSFGREGPGYQEYEDVEIGPERWLFRPEDPKWMEQYVQKVKQVGIEKGWYTESEPSKSQPKAP